MKRSAYVVRSSTARNYGGDIFALAMIDVLEKLGYEAWSVIRGEDPPSRYRTVDDLWLFLGHGVPGLYRDLPGRKVIYSFHPYGDDYGQYAARNFRTVKGCLVEGHAEVVFHYNLHTVEWMRRQGLPAYYSPVGYHETFEMGFDGELLNLGVYFLGRPRGRRKEILKACGAQCCNWLHRSAADAARRRAQLLNTDGVHLNLFHIPWRPFLALRVVTLLLANRRAVVSEPPDWSPLVSGEHYLEVPTADLPSACKSLLNDAKRRRELGEAGYDFVRTHYRLDQGLKQSLAEAGLL